MIATRLSSPKSRHEMPGSMLVGLCPGGTNDRSQAIYCLEQGSIENPSRRARSDSYPRLIRRTPVGPNHIVPYGTVPVFARIPGNKLPGYLHSLPPGQGHIPAISTSGSSSLWIVCDWSTLVIQLFSEMISTLGLRALELSILPIANLVRSVL